VRNTGRREIALADALQVVRRQLKQVVSSLLNRLQQFGLIDTLHQPEMSVRAGTFGSVEEEVGFVFAEAVTREKFRVSPNILIAGVKVEDNRLGRVKDFHESANDEKLGLQR
jgi:hypothetical protein